MKVAILSESPADEAAICVLVSGLLGVQIEPIPRRARAGGWNAAVEAVPPALKELHYRRTAAALVVVIDSDNSSVHQPQHEQLGYTEADCRFCRLRTIVRYVEKSLHPQPGQPPVSVALAVAVPAIEAWDRCGLDPASTEAGWIMRKQQGITAKAEVARLKRDVYGTDRPSLNVETTKATEQAQRLGTNLKIIEEFFPMSFGKFAAEVRSWLPR